MFAGNPVSCSPGVETRQSPRAPPSHMQKCLGNLRTTPVWLMCLHSTLMVFTPPPPPPVYSQRTAPRLQEGIQKASETARHYLKVGGGSHKKRKRERNSTTAATFFFILQQSAGKAASRLGGNGGNLVWGGNSWVLELTPQEEAEEANSITPTQSYHSQIKK